MKERILHILCRLIFIVAACPIDASALSSTDVTICNEYNEKSGIATETERDRLGRVTSQITRHNRHRLTEKEYIWGLNDQLLAITNNGKQTLFEYDGWGNLAKATYPDGKVEHRNPDRIGNLYASADKKDRKYGAGGRLEEDAEHFYHYDDEGNLIYKELRQFQEGVVNYNRKEEEQELNIKFRSTRTGWRYDWQSNGMLARVIRPDEQAVHFRYDALGRRTAKVFKGTVTRWIWDGNVPLHEWEYKAKDLQVAQDQQPPVEPTEDVTTWVFEEGTFVPAAKLKGDKRYSIVTDYLGTPIQMYDEQGEKTWDCTLDVYGKVATFEGSSLRECPFRYQGQYEDEETGLYYNRFRYYEPESGRYLSQDPIRLTGGNQLYNYVYDSNSWIDTIGLKGRGWLNWAKKWHDKRADEIFGEGKGRTVGGRYYDKSCDGKDIEFKSDNFSKGPRTKESLDRMNKQLDKDIANKIAGDANPHWHFDYDPSEVPEMQSLLKRMDENGITRSHGKTYKNSH